MNKIDRYDASDKPGEMYQSKDGEWVQFDEHQEVADALAVVTGMLSRLVESVEPHVGVLWSNQAYQFHAAKSMVETLSSDSEVSKNE